MNNSNCKIGTYNGFDVWLSNENAKFTLDIVRNGECLGSVEWNFEFNSEANIQLRHLLCGLEGWSRDKYLNEFDGKDDYIENDLDFYISDENGTFNVLSNLSHSDAKISFKFFKLTKTQAIQFYADLAANIRKLYKDYLN